MITHVIRRAAAADLITEVVVATDDSRIAEVCVAAGAIAVMTRDCRSGTDRVAEAVIDRPGWDLVVNVQGDEPLLSARNIDLLIEGMASTPQVAMGTLCRPLSDDRRDDPNAVKVVLDARGRALFFSRSLVPYPVTSKGEPTSPGDWLLHLGIYAYRRSFLLKLASLAPTPLEQRERLEQLRVLENGHSIAVAVVEKASIGIDTPELRGVEREDGLISRDRVRELILDKRVFIKTTKDKKGKYGRWLGEVYLSLDESSINALLISEGLAVPY